MLRVATSTSLRSPNAGSNSWLRSRSTITLCAAALRCLELRTRREPALVPHDFDESLVDERRQVCAQLALRRLHHAQSAVTPREGREGFAIRSRVHDVRHGHTAARLLQREMAQVCKDQRDLLLVNYERTIQNAFREVSDALISYRKVREVRVERTNLVNTLRDRTRLAYLRYNGGVANLLEALDADRELFEAELSLAQARRDELLTIVQIYKALGGGWPEMAQAGAQP